MHQRNKNKDRYDLEAMVINTPELKNYIQKTKLGKRSIDFSNPDAVRILNKAILNHYYGISYWEFPKENLCPPIPGRAEYIHHIADLLSENNNGKIAINEKIKCLDIGTGASCIYPIIGVTEYQWKFIASDIDRKTIKAAEKIVNSNPILKDRVVLKFQNQPKFIFRGIIEKEDKIDATICNPPYHSSIEEALKGTKRKIKNLTGQKVSKVKLNFSGNKNELICEGGEYQFIHSMILESKEFAKNCFWFSSQVSKKSNLKRLCGALEKNNPTEVKIINIGTGNKQNRILAWTYLNLKEKKRWQERR